MIAVQKISSFVNGAALLGDAASLASTNPARLDDVVAEVSLASAAQVV